MYSTIKYHKSHVWLAENTSTHRASALTFYNSDIQAGSAMAFFYKVDSLQGENCHCVMWRQTALFGLIRLLAYFKKNMYQSTFKSVL